MIRDALNSATIEVLNIRDLVDGLTLDGLSDVEVMEFPSENDGQPYMNIYLPVTDSLIKSLGFGIDFSQNDDWVNIYANFDPKKNHLWLSAVYVDVHGMDFEILVSLNKSEEMAVLKKLEVEFCEMYGYSLSEYAKNFLCF